MRRAFHRLMVLAAAGLPLLVSAAPLLPGPQLQAEGIPAFEPLAGAPRKEPAAPRFVAWNPLRAEMLVLARSGGSSQLQLLGGPQARLRVLTHGRDAVSGASWEPERGDYLVFSRDQGGDEAYRLYRLNPGDASAAPQPISPAGQRVADFEFLPAHGDQPGGLVYLLEQLDRQVSSDAERVAVSRLVWVDPLEPGRTRVLSELRGGRLTGLRVSPAGAIVVLSTVGRRNQLLRYDLGGGPGRPVGASSEVSDAGENADDEDVLWQRQATQGEFRHPQRLEVDSGRRKSWLADQDADLEALAVPPRAGDERPLALVYNEQGVSVLRLWRPGQMPLRIDQALAPGVISNPRWHARLPLLAFGHSSASSPGRIYVYDRERGSMQAWSGGETQGADTEYAALRWKSFDGLEISGLHIAPPPRFTGPRPVYISIHGGPSSQSRPGYLSPTLYQLVNELGMHVILPNVRGSEGFGKRFLALDNGRQREDSVRDISALLDLIATRADMDAAKVVVAGGSYGGYMSLAVATHESARIAGSICRVGIANFVSFLENTESYRRDNRRAEYGDERDPAMRAFLQRISPLSRAAEVKKPLFVVHGRNDPRVPYGEARAMVSAVRAQGTPVWFLTAEDEGHSFTKSDNSDYLRLATLEFVRRVLAGQPLHQAEEGVKPSASPASNAAP